MNISTIPVSRFNNNLSLGYWDLFVSHLECTLICQLARCNLCIQLSGSAAELLTYFVRCHSNDSPIRIFYIMAIMNRIQTGSRVFQLDFGSFIKGREDADTLRNWVLVASG